MSPLPLLLPCLPPLCRLPPPRQQLFLCPVLNTPLAPSLPPPPSVCSYNMPPPFPQVLHPEAAPGPPAETRGRGCLQARPGVRHQGAAGGGTLPRAARRALQRMILGNPLPPHPRHTPTPLPDTSLSVPTTARPPSAPSPLTWSTWSPRRWTPARPTTPFSPACRCVLALVLQANPHRRPIISATKQATPPPHLHLPHRRSTTGPLATAVPLPDLQIKSVDFNKRPHPHLCRSTTGPPT